MACGCIVVGSRTAPVLEVLRDGVNGLTVDVLAPKALATRIETALEHPEDMQTLRSAERRTALFDDLSNGRDRRALGRGLRRSTRSRVNA
jgi:glycosyltransferase involved in cell wall biosynthesis